MRKRIMQNKSGFSPFSSLGSFSGNEEDQNEGINDLRKFGIQLERITKKKPTLVKQNSVEFKQTLLPFKPKIKPINIRTPSYNEQIRFTQLQYEFPLSVKNKQIKDHTHSQFNLQQERRLILPQTVNKDRQRFFFPLATKQPVIQKTLFQQRMDKYHNQLKSKQQQPLLQVQQNTLSILNPKLQSINIQPNNIQKQATKKKLIKIKQRNNEQQQDSSHKFAYLIQVTQM